MPACEEAIVMAQLLRHRSDSAARSALRLVAVNGRRLPSQLEDVAPRDEPERVLDVQFEGITLAQQRAALAAFPGGRRFRLVEDLPG